MDPKVTGPAAARHFAEETKPVSTGTSIRKKVRVVLRVFVLEGLTHFRAGNTWGET